MGRFVILLRLAAAAAGWYLARKRGYNGIVWALLCGLVPPLVLVVMVLPRKMTQVCPYCRRPVPAGSAVCGHCRQPLPIDLVRCRSCGAFVPGQPTCSHCNAPLRR